jgi:flagellum-specific peptidoglycan hydrolase FlgJ
MVLRFFKDKKSTAISVTPSSPTLETLSAVTTQALGTNAPTEKITTISDSASTEAQTGREDVVSKVSTTNSAAPIVEPVTDNSKEIKLDKSTATTKPLTDYVQMASMQASAEDVIAAYKIFLGRLPESAQVVQQRTGLPVATLLIDFLASAEFLGHPMRAKLLLGLAKRVIETQATDEAQPDLSPNTKSPSSNPNP